MGGSRDYVTLPRMLSRYLALWNLRPDGEPILTPCGQLLPVLHGSMPLMLKIFLNDEEKLGGVLLEWWNGDGAAKVVHRDHAACLMERAPGTETLRRLVQSGQDDDACRILCRVGVRLHGVRSSACPDLPPLESWFGALESVAVHGGMFAQCAGTARSLLAEPQDIGVLHGDLHHNNVLEFGERGWLAIDPKGVVGERGSDFANIFLNPHLAVLDRPVATDPVVFRRRLEIVVLAASLVPDRLLQWIIAWAGLSAAWKIQDGAEKDIDWRIVELAAAERQA